MKMNLSRLPSLLPALAALMLLAGCAELDLDFGSDLDLFGPSEPAPPTPEMVAAPLPPPPPVTIYTLDLTLPMVEMWAAERSAARFITLHRLAAEGLIDPSRFERWAQLNRGAFLLFTAPPPIKGLAGKIPSYEEVVDYLDEIQSHRPEIAKVERAALLDRLMPMSGARASSQRPPKTEMLPRWSALLDHLAEEGALPAAAVAAEKAALAQVFGDDLTVSVSAPAATRRDSADPMPAAAHH
jgi:hypothetical protein